MAAGSGDMGGLGGRLDSSRRRSTWNILPLSPKSVLKQSLTPIAPAVSPSFY